MHLPHLLPNAEHISLEIVAYSWQIFRMNPLSHEAYAGDMDLDAWTKNAELWSIVQGDTVIILGQQGPEIRFQTWPEEGGGELVERLFRCDIQIEKLTHDLSVDEYVEAAACHWKGLWLLQQDPWETLVSFIISANKHFKHIQQCCTHLAEHYGPKITTPWGEFYAFPRPHALIDLSESELRACKVGYRARFIMDAAQRVHAEPNFLEKVYAMNSEEGVAWLTRITGIGDKIADCILLFAYARDGVVPNDVWLKRICVDLYDQNPKASYEELRLFHARHFGMYAGWAQQWLFCHARTVHKRGVSLKDTWFDGL